MKQFPSQLKYKKYHKIRSSFFVLKEQKKFFLPYEYGLKLLEPGRLTFSQLESCRKVIKRSAKKAYFKIDMFCSHPITGKAVASRMGKGKGGFKYWAKFVNKGYMVCGIADVEEFIALKILNSLQSKLPVKASISKL